MKRKRTEHRLRNFMGKFIPYAAIFLAVLGIAKVGTDTKNDPSYTSLDMVTMAANDYNVSAEQISALYVVANVSDSFDLASLDAVAGNYVTVSVMKDISQTSVDKIEKPSIVDTELARGGVTTHTVAEGETMLQIAARYGLTTDQIRWSNGLKNLNIAPGQVLWIPTTAGIVYVAKAGDTPESLAAKYGSSAEKIIAFNDLETQALSEGMRIALPGGVLPVRERPEYVAPVYSYTYAGSSSNRQNMNRVYENVTPGYGNRMIPGQCTYYAWWWRATHGKPLPEWLTGNANRWDNNLSGRWPIDGNPRPGDVFQTDSGSFGHVGIVLAVNGDGSLLVREMNYGNRSWVITESTIPASAVGSFKYIH